MRFCEQKVISGKSHRIVLLLPGVWVFRVIRHSTHVCGRVVMQDQATHSA